MAKDNVIETAKGKWIVPRSFGNADAIDSLNYSINQLNYDFETTKEQINTQFAEAAKNNSEALEALSKNMFNPDSGVIEEKVHAMMMKVGSDSMNYQLDETSTGSSIGINGEFKNGSCTNDRFIINGKDTLRHYSFIADEINKGTWEISDGINIELTEPSTYFVAIRCERNSTKGEWICDTIQHMVDELPNYWYFNWGIINYDPEKGRTLTETRGNSYMYGDNLVCGKIKTLTGNSYFDLTKGEFVLGEGGSQALSYKNGVLTIGGVATKEEADNILRNLGLLKDELSEDIDNAKTEINNQIAEKEQNILNQAAQQIANIVEPLQNQIDGVVDSWFFEGKPTLNNKPAVDWLSDETKKQHIGDTYTDISAYDENNPNSTAGRTWRWCEGDVTVEKIKFYLEDESDIRLKFLTTDSEYYDLDVYNDIVDNNLYDYLYYDKNNEETIVIDDDTYYLLKKSNDTFAILVKDIELFKEEAYNSLETNNIVNVDYIVNFYSNEDFETVYEGTDAVIKIKNIENVSGEIKGWHWHEVADSDSTRALLEASKAQAAADGKCTIFLTKPDKPYNVGDMWILQSSYTVITANGDRKTYEKGTILNSNTKSDTFDESHWTENVRYTDDTVANSALENIESTRQALNSTNDLLKKSLMDGYLSRDEQEQIRKSLTSLQKEFDETTQEYEDVYKSKYLNEEQKSELQNSYNEVKDRCDIYKSLLNELLAVDTTVDVKVELYGFNYENDFQKPMSDFNEAMVRYIGVLKRAQTQIQESLDLNAQKYADSKIEAQAYLTKALTNSTDIAGGLVMTNVLALRNSDGKTVTAGMSGIEEDNILLWGGGTYEDAVAAKNSEKYYKLNSTTPITTLIKKDGTGKIGVFEVDNDKAIINDNSSEERVILVNKSLSDSNVNTSEQSHCEWTQFNVKSQQYSKDLYFPLYPYGNLGSFEKVNWNGNRYISYIKMSGTLSNYHAGDIVKLEVLHEDTCIYSEYIVFGTNSFSESFEYVFRITNKGILNNDSNFDRFFIKITHENPETNASRSEIEFILSNVELHCSDNKTIMTSDGLYVLDNDAGFRVYSEYGKQNIIIQGLVDSKNFDYKENQLVKANQDTPFYHFINNTKNANRAWDVLLCQFKDLLIELTEKLNKLKEWNAVINNNFKIVDDNFTLIKDQLPSSGVPDMSADAGIATVAMTDMGTDTGVPAAGFGDFEVSGGAGDFDTGSIIIKSLQTFEDFDSLQTNISNLIKIIGNETDSSTYESSFGKDKEGKNERYKLLYKGSRQNPTIDTPIEYLRRQYISETKNTGGKLLDIAENNMFESGDNFNYIVLSKKAKQ